MARRKKKHVSLKPIVAAIRKAQRAARRFRTGLPATQKKRLNLKIKRLDKLRRSTASICGRAFNLI